MEPNQSKDNGCMQGSEQRCVHIIVEAPNTMEISVPSNGDGAKATRLSLVLGTHTPEESSSSQEPSLTKREQRAKEKREVEIKWRENQIDECARAATLAKEMGLGLQVRSHRALIGLHQRVIEALKASYNLIEMQGYMMVQVVECDAEEYKDPIPHDAITALQKAIDTELFDEFSVWTIRKDPILVGKIRKMKWDCPFEIARWD